MSKWGLWVVSGGYREGGREDVCAHWLRGGRGLHGYKSPVVGQFCWINQGRYYWGVGHWGVYDMVVHTARGVHGYTGGGGLHDLQCLCKWEDLGWGHTIFGY